MYISIIATAILVSLEALFVGISLKLQKGFKLVFAFMISGFLLAMSIIAFFASRVLIRFIGFEISWLVGGAFILLGIMTLFAKGEKQANLNIGTIIMASLIMSIDCVAATIALTISHGEKLVIPLMISLGHLVMLIAGYYAAKIIKTSYKVRKIISASCLFIIAVLIIAGVI
jgi:putative Mn2+ efflux pump MntP